HDHDQNWKMIGDFQKKRALVAIAVDPDNPQRLAVGTVHWGQGAPCKIFLTQNGGQDWQEITGDLPDGAGASSIAFSPDGKYLYLARSAGSVYRFPLE
ncbi:MAG: hypothetical protein NUV91_09725, partial [Candidatus Omnitrophica bacterium]|nr:hypothetical protein [Candidatus Omnitrophota bacterium]